MKKNLLILALLLICTACGKEKKLYYVYLGTPSSISSKVEEEIKTTLAIFSEEEKGMESIKLDVCGSSTLCEEKEEIRKKLASKGCTKAYQWPQNLSKEQVEKVKEQAKKNKYITIVFELLEK